MKWADSVGTAELKDTSLVAIKLNINLRIVLFHTYYMLFLKVNSRLCLRLWKTSSRRPDQDEYVRPSLTSSEDVLKTSWLRPIYSSWLYVFKTSSRCFQDVFKKTLRRFAERASRHLQDVFKTFWRRLRNVFKTSWKTSSRHLQDVFKTYHQVKLFLVTRLWEAFNTFLRRSFPKTIIYRGICPGNTDKFMISVQNLQER